MSLEYLLSEIKKNGSKQVDAINHQTQNEAEKILKQAKSEAITLFQQTRDLEVQRAHYEARLIEQQSTLDSEKIRYNMLQKLVDESIENIQAAVLQARQNRESYPVILKSLVQEAVSASNAIDATGCCLIADSRDRTCLQDILAHMKLDVNVRYELHCAGGVQLELSAGRILLDNTIEERIQRAKPYLRQYLTDKYAEMLLYRQCDE